LWMTDPSSSQSKKWALSCARFCAPGPQLNTYCCLFFGYANAARRRGS
jgi:hypothetical protein